MRLFPRHSGSRGPERALSSSLRRRWDGDPSYLTLASPASFQLDESKFPHHPLRPHGPPPSLLTIAPAVAEGDRKKEF